MFNDDELLEYLFVTGQLDEDEKEETEDKEHTKEKEYGKYYH